MRGWLIAVCLALSGCASAGPTQDTQQGIQDVISCLKLSAQKLDDLRSDATSVAYGLTGACSSEINRSIEAGGQGMTFEVYQSFRARTNAFWLKTATEIVLSARAARGNSR
jgi:hypothetical protein